MHPPYRGLAFLLSVGSLPIACGKDNEESDTKSTTTTTGDGESTTGGTTTSMTGSTTVTPTTGGSGSASETGTTDTPGTDGSQGFITTATSSGTTGDTGGPPPVTDPTCIAYGAHIVECFPRYAGYRQEIGGYCEYYKMYGLMADGQACADAIDALFVCLSELPCAELGMDTACAKETATVTQDCPSTGGSSSTGP